jgi:hypothetical protein
MSSRRVLVGKSLHQFTRKGVPKDSPSCNPLSHKKQTTIKLSSNRPRESSPGLFNCLSAASCLRRKPSRKIVSEREVGVSEANE